MGWAEAEGEWTGHFLQREEAGGAARWHFAAAAAVASVRGYSAHVQCQKEIERMAVRKLHGHDCAASLEVETVNL